MEELKPPRWLWSGGRLVGRPPDLFLSAGRLARSVDEKVRSGEPTMSSTTMGQFLQHVSLTGRPGRAHQTPDPFAGASGASSLRCRTFLGNFILMLAMVPGCSPSSESPVTSQLPGTSDPPVVSPTGQVTVLPLDREGYDRFLSDHAGQVVLVDFWATWCPACLEGFPHTVECQRQYGNQGLVVASIAINEAEDQPQVLEFLRSQTASFANFRSAYGGGVTAMDAFEISSGTLPTLKLYDRSGKLRYTFGDGEPFEDAQIDVAIRQLLGES